MPLSCVFLKEEGAGSALVIWRDVIEVGGLRRLARHQHDRRTATHMLANAAAKA